MNKDVTNIKKTQNQFDPSLISEIMNSVDTNNRANVIKIIEELPPADIADIIQLLRSSERTSFLDIIKDHFDPEILSDLEEGVRAVSYTHLTLPTKRIV